MLGRVCQRGWRAGCWAVPARGIAGLALLDQSQVTSTGVLPHSLLRASAAHACHVAEGVSRSPCLPRTILATAPTSAPPPHCTHSNPAGRPPATAPETRVLLHLLQVLDSCGVEPYSEAFERNKQQMDGLVAQLRAGEAAGGRAGGRLGGWE